MYKSEDANLITESKSAERIGILGGTFDPIHNGHIRLAACARDRFNLDKVLLMPSDDPYYKSKSNVSAFEDRFSMVSLAVKGQEALYASDFEKVHDTDGYTVNTLSAFLKENPGCRLFFIVGGDSLFTMENWKDISDIFKMAVILVGKRKDETKGASGSISVSSGNNRSDDVWSFRDDAGNTDNNKALTDKKPGDELDVQISYLTEKYNAEIHNLYIERFDVSSSELRESIRCGRDVCGLVPDSVLQYISDHNLYRS